MQRSRRTVLKSIGAGTTGLAAVGSLGTATAASDGPPTPVEEASAEQYDTRSSNFTTFDWNCARVRVYLTNRHSYSDLADTLDSMAQFLDNVVEATDRLEGYLVTGFDTNVDSFNDAGDDADERLVQYDWADQYVNAFGHDRYGGANIWLDDDGGALGVSQDNHACGPRPYNTDYDYPHAFKMPGKAKDPVEGEEVTWAVCHELFHLLVWPDRAWLGGYGTDEFDGESPDHALATADRHVEWPTRWNPEYHRYVTVTSDPATYGWQYGDCSRDPDEFDPEYNSIQVSDCEAGAVDDTIEYVRENHSSQCPRCEKRY